MLKKISTLSVKQTSINVFQSKEQEYISLTDIASFKNPIEPKDVVKNWLRSKSTIEFLGLWEKINNQNFKGVEFDSFLLEAGSNSFTLSPSKWIEVTNAIGIVSKQGRGGGTFAQKDIAFEFAAWVSAEFKLYLIKEYQRLKEEEHHSKSLEWSVSRTLAKINYQIHTDAIKGNLIPKEIDKNHFNFIYADEADLLNLALFGLTAKEWRNNKPDKKGNMRDQATIEQLVVLSNLESLNAVFIQQGISQSDRLIQLNNIAIQQMKSLMNNQKIKKLEKNEANKEKNNLS